jgi:MFS family permease
LTPHSASSAHAAATSAKRQVGRLTKWSSQHLEQSLGGPQRTRVIVVLACVLALSSADTATVGASATQLRNALHISNTDIGLLVAVNSLVAAVASVPFGALADRVRRTRLLGISIIVWGLAMVWSATAPDFGRLLLARLFLGVVTATAGPVVASLIGDYFDSGERGKIYGYVLTGELLGAGIGFAVTGDIAALSWRAAFVILAIPAFFLARYVFALPEPVRGGSHPLTPHGIPRAPRPPEEPPGETDAQRLVRQRGIAPDPAMIVGQAHRSMSLITSTKYLLRIPTNRTLIIASAFGYFYLAGLQTFAVEFVKPQYGIDQALANLLLLVLGAGAVVGTLVSGRFSDRLLQRGVLNARIHVATVAAALTAVLFIPALLTRHVGMALPYLVIASLMLSAQNPPVDAARLDIVPAFLWGRAEGLRTALRTAAQALAPLLFGALSDYVFGGGRGGLEITFLVMLLPLGANALFLGRAVRSYPRDVATAASAEDAGVGEEQPPAPTRVDVAGPFDGLARTDDPAPDTWPGTVIAPRPPIGPDQ